MNKKIFNFSFGNYSLTLTKRIGNYRKDETDSSSILPSQEYNRFFEKVGRWMLERHEKDERLHLLNFLLTIVKKDIQFDLLSEIFYKEQKYITDLTRKCFIPLWYVDEKGNEKKLEPIGKKRVNLSETTTIVIPWKLTSMRNAIINIAKNGFKYSKENHSPAYYFTEMDLCYIKSGNHHIASGIIQNSGYVEAVVYDTTLLFHHIATDGGYWLNAHTKKPLAFSDSFNRMTFEKVFDFRIAVLYELARMSWHEGSMLKAW